MGHIRQTYSLFKIPIGKQALSSTLMNLSIGHISELIEPTRSHLMRHPVYTQMSELRHVQIFMEHHVYAVWDFMSLLKSLQSKFGSFRIPWTPSNHPGAVRSKKNQNILNK